MEIKIVDVTKKFKNKTVIDKLSLVIGSGSFTTLLGPSGCGKTTLLRMIAGLETPDTGEIYFNGRCVFSREKKINVPPEARGLGFVFQDFALWPHMTVFENVAFGLRASKNTQNLEEKVHEALHAVQLEDYADRYPHQLSGGQQQRLCIARARAVQPEVILMDEPTSALDPISTSKIEELAMELRKEYTIVMVTHNMQQAARISDRTVFFLLGEVIEEGRTEELFAMPKNKKTEDYITGRFG